MTCPLWISAAAAFVTAGVMRLVAPVSSFGPKGDAFTRALQSAWASAPPHPPKNASKLSTATKRASNLMGSSLRSAPGTLEFFCNSPMMAASIGIFNDLCPRRGYAAIHPPSNGSAAAAQAASPNRESISAATFARQQMGALKMEFWLDVGAAVFAIGAAIFWFLSAYGELPKPVSG